MLTNSILWNDIKELFTSANPNATNVFDTLVPVFGDYFELALSKEDAISRVKSVIHKECSNTAKTEHTLHEQVLQLFSSNLDQMLFALFQSKKYHVVSSTVHHEWSLIATKMKSVYDAIPKPDQQLKPNPKENDEDFDIAIDRPKRRDKDDRVNLGKPRKTFLVERVKVNEPPFEKPIVNFVKQFQDGQRSHIIKVLQAVQDASPQSPWLYLCLTYVEKFFSDKTNWRSTLMETITACLSEMQADFEYLVKSIAYRQKGLVGKSQKINEEFVKFYMHFDYIYMFLFHPDQLVTLETTMKLTKLKV
ncbi:hypothetical protein BCR44DRAFT_23425 [Catenaria anguillulae PL171]|uniref:Uncharacterized protein n=1 Tax=Catenaria anguillulae PL171 TaxID=765915 RepID=A0A1Y2GFQ9_9FUNG|nr:hypothetical protein BCR44DRAFT_23425 [Catenaria anguillulae PL171]